MEEKAIELEYKETLEHSDEKERKMRSLDDLIKQAVCKELLMDSSKLNGNRYIKALFHHLKSSPRSYYENRVQKDINFHIDLLKG